MRDRINRLSKVLGLSKERIRQDREEDTQYKLLMKRRAGKLLGRMSLGEWSKGNFWVKREPAYLLYSLVESVHDDYGGL